jgi:hypothetical protein
MLGNKPQHEYAVTVMAAAMHECMLQILAAADAIGNQEQAQSAEQNHTLNHPRSSTHNTCHSAQPHTAPDTNIHNNQNMHNHPASLLQVTLFRMRAGRPPE